ncbi:PaaI family thioesterase [Sphingomonas ginkgonis]|uniref:PaaI family thioesterase n=1 Tax=Sphingomonas ginkgonis TaxID=2315330 RepID=A0A3R9YKA8_9SPHN|nr:PaaI family thioesterase [Sphingomonas ginkgonis]RST31797.1 PaaI family thioesterase [Sphingomonas ginkgonis]
MDDASPPLPQRAVEHPDHPGWYWNGPLPRSSFAAATGPMIYRPDGPGRGIVRMFPTEGHLNMGGSLHGGAVMSFIDMSLFIGGHCAGMKRGHFVTLDLTTHFLGRGRPGEPLDAHVELIKETRSFSFLQGVVRQSDQPCYSFAGTLKRVRERS